MFKRADRHDLPVVERIMKRIHDEEPSYWPHGLRTDHFNGGLYLVQKSASAEPVGFVGWQRFNEGERRVGYYAIGILPEHRERGFAKQAVAQVIREIGNQCDEVKAYIMAHNEPSKALAESLQIPVIEKLASLEKSADAKVALIKALKQLGSGAATAGLIDLAVNKDKGAIGHYALGNEGADPWSGADFGLNFLAGAVAPWQKNVGLAAALTGLAAGKTIAAPAVRRMGDRNEIFQEIADKMDKAAPEAAPSGKNLVESIPKEVWLGAGGLGLGALGLGAYKALSNSRAKKKERALKERELDQAEAGKVHVTLPTEKPGDVETLIELPVGDLNLSKTLRGNLGRDTRRRLIEETRKRTRHRRPRQKAASSSFDGLLAALEKAAIGPTPAPQQNVPSPPGVGGNPAMQMQQTSQAVAMQPTPAPDANPQVMQAQQKAQEATMQAQQQAAQSQAQAEQQMAQQSQQAQQELAKQQQAYEQKIRDAETQKQTLELALEKEKVLKELNDAQSKAQAEAGDGDGTQVQRLATSRLQRLHKRVGGLGKIATTTPPANPVPPGTPGTLNPVDGSTIPKPTYIVPDGTAQRLNSSPAGHAFVAPTTVARHSYGPIGDWFYDFFLKRPMTTPGNMPSSDMSGSDLTLHPNKWRALEKFYQYGTGALRGPRL